ncbi:hypothetical protein K1719_041926 [Acacia pycnantha]|nr:hypothetical protein K1719_041926 [Acacia pycnantha]
MISRVSSMKESDFEMFQSFIHGLDKKTSASSKLTVLNPACRIWTMVAREVLVSSMPTQLEILDMHLSLETTQNTAEHQKKRSCINARVVIDRHNSSTKGEGTARSSKDTHIREERRPQLSERSSEIAGTRGKHRHPYSGLWTRRNHDRYLQTAIQCIIATA